MVIAVSIDKGYQSGRSFEEDGHSMYAPIAWFELSQAAEDYAKMISEKLDCKAIVEEWPGQIPNR